MLENSQITKGRACMLKLYLCHNTVEKSMLTLTALVMDSVANVSVYVYFVAELVNIRFLQSKQINGVEKLFAFLSCDWLLEIKPARSSYSIRAI